MPDTPIKRDRERLLGFPARRLMLQIIEDDPGIFVSDLHLLLDMDVGGFYYHLKMLRDAGVVEERVTGEGRKALYAAGKAPPQGREDDPLFSDIARRVAEAVLTRPGVSSSEIMAQTGLAERTVQRHLRRLVEAGLAQDIRDGRNITYSPTRRLHQAWNTK